MIVDLSYNLCNVVLQIVIYSDEHLYSWHYRCLLIYVIFDFSLLPLLLLVK